MIELSPDAQFWSILILAGSLLLYFGVKGLVWLFRRIKSTLHFILHHKSLVQTLSGNVTYVRAVSRRVAHIQLAGYTTPIEVYSTDYWILKRGDHVMVSGYPDTTGRFIGLAYANTTQQVQDHAVLNHDHWIYMLIGVFGSLYAYVVMPVAMLVTMLFLFAWIKGLREEILIRASNEKLGRILGQDHSWK